ncbi:MAG: glycosyltransferase family 39 protein [Patescibacteria group bacterium]
MKNWPIIVILAIAFILRIVGLQSYPAGFTPDEASFGYDAYSILKTGKDQWGNSLPLTFKSFGDNKLPLYTYLTIPSVFVFGLSEFAVRLPNAMLSSLAILVTYLLVKELFGSKKYAYLASFLLAVSPWHVFMSRGAFEANLTTFLLPLGILFFYKGLKNQKYLYLSALVFGLNLFSYHSARLITPLIVGFLVFISLKNFVSLKKYVFSGVVFGIFCAFALTNILSGGASRVSTAGIFNATEGANSISQSRYDAILGGINPQLAIIFGNKFNYFSDTFIKNYISYFSPQFLFSEGAREGTYGMVPGIGLMYIFEIVFLFGFILFLGKKNKNRNIWLLVFWILVSAIPASMAKGPGHAANRVAIMMPAIQIASAMGGVYLYEKLRPKYRSVAGGMCFCLFAISFIFFLEKYLITQPMRGAKAMIYGTKQVVEFVSATAKKGKYDNIYISKKMSEPHIYFAFYNQMNPRVIQNDSKNWNFVEQGFSWVDQMGRYKLNGYTFKSIDGKNEVGSPGFNLFVGPREDFSENIQPLKVIKYPNGEDAYLIVESQRP